MTEYVASSLFVYTADTRELAVELQANTFGIKITPLAFDELQQDPEALLSGAGHVVVAGPLGVIKDVLGFSRQYGFSVGILPTKSQKSLKRYFALPDNIEQRVELALRQDAQPMDLILCNGKILLFNATIGRLPLLDSSGEVGLWKVLSGIRSRLKGLKLLGFNFTTAGERKINTAACGCMVVQHHRGSLASRLISHDSSASDGMISLVVASPSSIVAYLRFLVQSLRQNGARRRIPSTIGYIKSSQVQIESERELAVFVDGESLTHTPVQCEVIPHAVRINTGVELRSEAKASEPAIERVDVKNLPAGKEVAKARKKTIPVFAYASEERFRDLFKALRDDARIKSSYLVLMVLSTMLATVGLYLNSSSVVIGAMLLAPLMTPIVSLAMGLLRRDQKMTNLSAGKIVVGVGIALLAAAAVTLLFPHKPVTDEMTARLSPSLLDLGVAIFAGIAGAYTKSYKEILQSLAGVAIAVALVPPLAVAGTGLGRLDPYFFSQAFLLFSTNLVGIVLAAAFTFRVLGYSAVVGDKRSIGFVALLLALISVPLYFTYDDIVEKIVFEKSWMRERFLVNGKYLIVQKADLVHYRDKDVIKMQILARERLDRNDMDAFQKKIQTNFPRKLVIRASITYIL